MSTIPPPAEEHKKWFTPLESNPEIFNPLAYSLGLSHSLEFHEVYTLDAELLTFIPSPVYAFVLVFPTDQDYDERRKRALRETESDSEGGNGDERVVFFQQTIGNACGLHGLLHAVCNGEARRQILPDTLLARILSLHSVTEPSERHKVLDEWEFPELNKRYHEVALDGATEPPQNAEADVDYHYTCFTKSKVDNHLYELDSDRVAPIDIGIMRPQDDMRCKYALDAIKHRIASNEVGGIEFNIMALAPSSGKVGEEREPSESSQ